MELSFTLLNKNQESPTLSQLRIRRSDLTLLSDLISLRNKKALITGSGAGIGKAIAHRLVCATKL